MKKASLFLIVLFILAMTSMVRAETLGSWWYGNDENAEGMGKFVEGNNVMVVGWR